ncbi:MAG TPA: bestrophin family ion channel [Labilithrix sp.]|nr:bestrophin family ion channel [Labilithrix sp.]
MLSAKSVPITYAFNNVKADVVRVMFFSLLFHGVKIIIKESLPEIPAVLPTVLGTSITLLLAFNVNQSYDRWWEARKIWGSIVNDSRSLILQIGSFAVDRGDHRVAPVLERAVFRQIVFCYSLGQTLRGRPPLTEEQKQLLSAEDLMFVLAQNNQPLGLLMRHQMDLRVLHQRGQINDFQQIQIDATLVRLCDSMGRAERIKSTVFPVTYRLFIHYFIYLFLIVVSMVLVRTLGAYEIPILVLLASTFFLLEKTALHMQDPFSDRPTDTAVTAIARTIEINLRQLIGNEDVPPPLTPDGFYLM